MMKKLWTKYRELITYLISGVITTLSCWAGCFVCKQFMDETVAWQNAVINSVGWVVGIAVSFPLNKLWVFRSEGHLWQELWQFVASRLSTWLIDLLIMWLCVNVLKWNYWISRIFIATVIVTVLNYILGKLVVFKKPGESKSEKS